MKQVVMAILIASCTNGAVSATELVNLDGFLAGFERSGSEGGGEKGELAEFSKQLNARYNFEYGNRKANTKIHIPPQFAGAIGKASVRNGGDRTIIHVPVIGTYRGLRTLKFGMEGGHIKGINVSHIPFNETKQNVERVLGEHLRPAKKKVSVEEDLGLKSVAEIVKEGKRALLLCDSSS